MNLVPTPVDSCPRGGRHRRYSVDCIFQRGVDFFQQRPECLIDEIRAGNYRRLTLLALPRSLKNARTQQPAELWRAIRFQLTGLCRCPSCSGNLLFAVASIVGNCGFGKRASKKVWPQRRCGRHNEPFERRSSQFRVREAAAKPVRGPNNLLQRKPLHAAAAAACQLQPTWAGGQRADDLVRSWYLLCLHNYLVKQEFCIEKMWHSLDGQG